ncbi:phage baseplate assembly protein domain-containing protein [Pseudomonas kermanshahensis]|uniref:phage baseplate assembly protein domain-containing protein n=1 Tax=Pseudomonas kermanshahensis TaxID=2745482 RepID=UPI0020932B80|nr:phage baseplate assembly protein [Pseudomonas kermanshahensis]USS56975.1 phage baseplate assembly protein [Pseudomonas kermanshahensis]
MASLPALVREQVDRALRGVRQAFRAVGTRNTHGPSIGVQMEGLAGETVAGELAQHYGFTSAPLAGAEFIALPIGGNSKHVVVIATEDARYRLKVKDGEVAIYSDEGDHVHLKRGRVIEVVTDTLLVKASTKVRFETPMIETTGQVQADGNIQSAADLIDQVRSMQADREIYNTHKHGNSPTPTPEQ